jgi:hypothetical protein
MWILRELSSEDGSPWLVLAAHFQDWSTSEIPRIGFARKPTKSRLKKLTEEEDAL